ncbi:ScbA/BarX family gamma-butyrolactone biosynthesis protein [Streptomyces sp. MS1.HAVA.3]|uniref:ScbA/BarX family gamma-butyrolactone biosynthesis protein n=1 Tax=Streptomyces caledonius TaxID=3134107 RepID=A0ABU8UC13_9ACTN
MTVSADHSASPIAALSSALPREYVHKSAHSEVLLTGWRPVAPDEYVVTAQWPRAHSFYTPDGGHHDPLLLAESVRQAIPLLSHVAYDVPFGHRQIWDTFSYSTNPEALVVGSVPADIVLHIRCSGIARRGRRLAGLTMHVTATRDGEYLGTAEAGFTNQPEAVYQRLRGRNADLDQVAARVIPLPLTPRRVGRDRFHDVVLSPTSSTRRTQLRADINHPILFDHPVDHAPGMLLLEAVRQAAYCSAFPRRGVLTAMEMRFFRYAELNSPCWIETTPAAEGATATDRHPVRVLARQNGEDVFTATATITTTAPAPSASAPRPDLPAGEERFVSCSPKRPDSLRRTTKAPARVPARQAPFSSPTRGSRHVVVRHVAVVVPCPAGADAVVGRVHRTDAGGDPGRVLRFPRCYAIAAVFHHLFGSADERPQADHRCHDFDELHELAHGGNAPQSTMKAPQPSAVSVCGPARAAAIGHGPAIGQG